MALRRIDKIIQRICHLDVFISMVIITLADITCHYFFILRKSEYFMIYLVRPEQIFSDRTIDRYLSMKYLFRQNQMCQIFGTAVFSLNNFPNQYLNNYIHTLNEENGLSLDREPTPEHSNLLFNIIYKEI